MSMNNDLRVSLTTTYTGVPLAVIDGLPGGSAELTPALCRALAATLQRIANDAESRKLLHRGKPLPATRREYLITD